MIISTDNIDRDISLSLKMFYWFMASSITNLGIRFFLFKKGLISLTFPKIWLNIFDSH